MPRHRPSPDRGRGIEASSPSRMPPQRNEVFGTDRYRRPGGKHDVGAHGRIVIARRQNQTADVLRVSAQKTTLEEVREGPIASFGTAAKQAATRSPRRR